MAGPLPDMEEVPEKRRRRRKPAHDGGGGPEGVGEGLETGMPGCHESAA